MAGQTYSTLPMSCQNSANRCALDFCASKLVTLFIIRLSLRKFPFLVRKGEKFGKFYLVISKMAGREGNGLKWPITALK